MAQAVVSSPRNPRRSIMQEPAVYQLLGRLENGMANANKKLDELTSKVESITESNDKSSDRIDVLEPHVNDWVQTKKRALMAIFGLGALGGAGGSGISDAIRTLFGWQ